MDDLTGEFVAETRETLEHIAEALVKWEAQPDDAARLDEIFRFVHTVKGSCGFLDLPRIGALAHAAETALGEVRAGTRVADAPLVNAMLAIIDRISALSEALESKAEVATVETDAVLIAAIDARDPVISNETIPATVKPVRNVRVAVEVLEMAMAQVSDLVLARNALARQMREIEPDAQLAAAFDRVSGAIGDVRETIARTRMQPIDRLFALLPRLVRDTANAVGKSVQLRIEGSDVEIDREMIEAMRDPLTHIVRNAIDHGIEPTAERLRSGKDAAGLLTVVARQSGNQVSITVGDDGRGIDVARLIEKAVAAKVVSPVQAGALSPEAAAQLIFAPGLSTAGAVTALSGRGVGMDIVRANVERLGGAILLDNRPGRGLAITLRAPLTLSIMNALLVETGGQVLALPRACIDEIVSVKSASVRVEAVGGGHVAVVRGRMLAVVSLAAMLSVRDEPLSHLVIVDPPGANRFALGVAHVRDHEELVVRPTAPSVAALGTYAGQSLPDNGVPILVIDLAGIAARAGVEDERRHKVAAADIFVASPAQSLLMLQGLDGTLKAVRAAQVERIEDVTARDFTMHGDHSYVNVGGELLPVVIDGELPPEGQVGLLRMSGNAGAICYAVRGVHDLVPLPGIAPVGDGIVEGFVLIDDVTVPLLAWPRVLPAERARRKRA